MPDSPRFVQLQARISQLKNNLIPTINVTLNYTQEELDRTSAYRMLVHAEIESFLEDRALSVAESAYNSWLTDGKPRRALLALLAFCEKEKWPLVKTFTEIRKDKKLYFDNIGERLGEAIRLFNRKIRVDNHGIKEEQIVEILIPVGIALADLDKAWLATMNSFGSSRGEVAHSASSAWKQIDPQTEVDLIEKQILPELQEIDKKLSALSRPSNALNAARNRPFRMRLWLAARILFGR